MKIDFISKEDLTHLIMLLKQVEVDVTDSSINAKDLISIIQGYQQNNEKLERLNERIASAYTYVSVAASKLEGKI